MATLKGGIDRSISVAVWPFIIWSSRARRFIADPIRVGDHARKWWIRQQADELFVIDADDRDFLGYGHSRAPTCVEHLDPADIVAGHDPQRLGQSLDPLGDPLDLIFPGSLLMAPGDAASGQALVNLMAGRAGRGW